MADQTWINLLFLTVTVLVYEGVRGDSTLQPGSNSPNPTTGYACEGSYLNIKCGPGRKIQILRANYGRFKLSICNDRGVAGGWNLECMSTRSLNIVNQMCSEKRNCIVHSSNRKFGDPCNNTPKYLEVQYLCIKAYVAPPSTASVPVPPSTAISTKAATTAAVTTSTTGARPASTDRPSPIMDQRFCEHAVARNVSWPRTNAGKEARKECPNNLNLRAAVWRCGSNPVQWMGKPDLSRCVSLETQELENKLNNAKRQMSAEIVEEVAADLVKLSSKKDAYGGDLTHMAKVMEEMVQQVDVQVNNNVSATPVFVEKVQKAVMNASSNLLDSGAQETWKDLPQADQAKTATRVVSAVENSAFQMAKLHKRPTVVIDITVNIMLEVNVVASDTTEDLVFPREESLKGQWREGPDSQIRLSSQAIKELGVDGLARVIFLTYNNLEEFLRPQGDGPHNEFSMVETEVHSVQPLDEQEDLYQEAKGREEEVYHPKDHEVKNYAGDNDILNREADNTDSGEEEKPDARHQSETVVNSKVISASVNERNEGKTQPLAEPIYYTLEHKTTDNVYNPSCSFWEYSEKTMSGKWSQFGCEVSDTNVTHTTCRCNHLTNFAVLMDVRGTLLPSHHQFALSFITYIGCIISITCLFVAFCTFQFFKNLQCDRNTIHKNLCLSLFIAEVIFLAGIAQYEQEILCGIVAGLLHYFFLASFAWMCMEGIQLYVMLIEVFEAERSRVKYYYLAAYGIPAIVVGIAAAVDYSGYGTDTHCWLRIDNGFIWAFVGPVVAVISVNVVMLSIAIYMMCKHASTAAAWKMKKKSRMDNVKSWLKGATVLVVLLGLTWSFGLLYINEQSVALAYIFTLLNCLQGLFIFIFHCVMNEKVQKEYKRACRRATWLPEIIRVRYGGAKPYASSTPSTSGGNKIMTTKITPASQERRLSLEYFTRLLSGRRRKRSSTTSLPKSSSGMSGFSSKKEQLSNGVCRESQLTNPPSPHDSAIYSEPTEDPNAYLEPVSLKIALHDSVFEDGNFDLSAIEGSVVNSDFLSEYCRNGMPMNVDKYKIQQTPPSQRGKDSRPESLYDDPDMKKLREKERLLSDYDNSSCPNLDSDTDDGFDSLPKKRLSDGNVPASQRNLNNLNRASSSNEDNREECIYTEIAEVAGEGTLSGNIPNSAGTLKRDNVTQVSPVELAGAPAVYSAQPRDSRISAGTATAMDANRTRATSSDC